MVSFKRLLLCAGWLTVSTSAPNHKLPRAPSSDYVNQTTCNGQIYTYNQLAGYGFIPSNARDKFGDTIGGIGSSIAIDKSTWRKRRNGSYTGILWALPDRGWYVSKRRYYLPILVLMVALGIQKELSTIKIESTRSQ